MGNRKKFNHLLWLYRLEIPENHACQRTLNGQLLVIIHNIIPLKIETRRIKDMLVLSRKESEKIRLGEDVILTIVRVSGDRVRLGIQAPSNMLILREELNPEAVMETSETSAVA